MAHKSTNMSSAGRDKAVTAEEIFEMMEGSGRPAWSAKDIGDHFDVSTPTAKARLNELDEDGWVKAVQVSNVTAYYVPESDDLNREEELEQDLRREFEDQFVGLPSAPWTAVNPEHGAAKAGSEVQLVVSGEPGHWRIIEAHAGIEYEELPDDKTDDETTQALLSGRLYAEPTTPIEHIQYPDEPDLETQLGVNIELAGNKAVLIADGPNSHLLRPCNEAVFITDVQIDTLVVEGEGQSNAVPPGLLDTHPTRSPAGEKEVEIERQAEAMFEGLDEDK